MFITNNHASFHLWWDENFVKHQNVSKYYDQDCRAWLARRGYLRRKTNALFKCGIHSPNHQDRTHMQTYQSLSNLSMFFQQKLCLWLNHTESHSRWIHCYTSWLWFLCENRYTVIFITEVYLIFNVFNIFHCYCPLTLISLQVYFFIGMCDHEILLTKNCKNGPNLSKLESLMIYFKNYISNTNDTFDLPSVAENSFSSGLASFFDFESVLHVYQTFVYSI